MKTHYQELFIKDINEATLRARILGKVIEKSNNGFIIDDGTGIIEVMVNEGMSLIRGDFDVGKDIMIFGKVITIDDTQKIFADLVLDVQNLNVKQYRKIISLTKELEESGFL